MEFKFERKTFNIEGRLKVGVISDSQLSPVRRKNETTFRKNLVLSLLSLKNQGCNMIIFAGDICNMASAYAYDTYVDAFKSVFGEKMPVVQSIMGNHDYYGRGTPDNCRRLFTRKIGTSPFTHYTVNGFHFIGVSPDCAKMSDGYRKILPYLKNEIEIAKKECGDRPVFVTTHNSPENTVYGSDDWGDKSLFDAFSQYHNVVNFAGHTHYSLLDERSVWQGAFTAFGTQSVSYTELERGKVNGTVPPDAYMFPMGYILDFGSENITVRRMNFRLDKEEKPNMNVKIPYSVKKADFITKRNGNSLPVMPNTYGHTEYDEKGTAYLCFDKGESEDAVHSYAVLYDDGTRRDYFSDFYKGCGAAKSVKLPVYSKAPGVYNIKIYAVDSFGNMSDTCTKIDATEVRRNKIYRRKFAPEIKY